VLEIERPTRLRCSWTIEGIQSTVTFELQADGSGTLLRLEHDALTDEHRDLFADGWDQKLRDDLRVMLDSTDNETREQ
jgi:uncharacterized protein YndB with AHSA1/START domain